MTCRRFLIVDDHPVVRDGFRHIIESSFKSSEIQELDSPYQAEWFNSSQTRPHLVILDLQIPGVSGFSGLLSILARCPKSPILVVSETADIPTIRRALTLGATGFVSKAHECHQMRSAVTTVAAGKSWFPAHYDQTRQDDAKVADIAKRFKTLSPQQRRIFDMLREGLLNKQIAFDLGLAEATVKAHVTVILRKLGATNRTHAVIIMQGVDRFVAEARPAPNRLPQKLEEAQLVFG